MNRPSAQTDAIRPLLRRIGLEDKEIEIYLALLAIKAGRASAVAKAAKQSRSHTYLILRNLVSKGLAAEVERGSVIHFIAEPPERLKQYVENREQELKSLAPLIDGILPVLSSLTKPLTGAPRVVMQKGMDGMKQLYRDALHQEIRGIFNPASMYEAFGENIVAKILGKHSSIKGRDLFVRNEAAKKYLAEIEQSDDYQIRFLPETTVFNSDTMVFGDTVALLSYDDEHTIVRIENKNIADAFRTWFEILWSASTPS